MTQPKGLTKLITSLMELRHSNDTVYASQIGELLDEYLLNIVSDTEPEAEKPRKTKKRSRGTYLVNMPKTLDERIAERRDLVRHLTEKLAHTPRGNERAKVQSKLYYHSKQLDRLEGVAQPAKKERKPVTRQQLMRTHKRLTDKRERIRAKMAALSGTDHRYINLSRSLKITNEHIADITRDIKRMR